MAIYKDFINEYDKLNQSIKFRHYFNITATLALLILLLILIYPAIKHITKVNKEISDAKVVKASLEKKISDLEVARINIEQLSEDLKILDKALPLGPGLQQYLPRIERLVASHNLNLSSIEFTHVPLSVPKSSDPTTKRKLSFTFTVEGSFTDYKNLLKELENIVRTSEVMSINISRDSISGALKGKSSVDTFFIGFDITTNQLEETKTGEQQQ